MEGLVVSIVICMEVLDAAAVTATIQLPPPMYVFGDANLDVGNNNFLRGPNVSRANKLYYGVDFPGIPTGRFSNGYNTADYIAKKIGLVISPPAYLSLALSSSLVATTALTTGMSYASGGAGILDSTNAGNSIPLRKQVQYFNATRSKMVAAVGSDAVDTLLSRSVILIDIGSSDLLAFAFEEIAQGRSGEEKYRVLDIFFDDLMSNYSAAITDLYTLGARKFALTNVGLIGCLPVTRLLDEDDFCLDNYLPYRFDKRLRSLLDDDLTARLPGFLYSVGDAYYLMTDAIYNRKAGFTDLASACCGGGRLGAEAECSPNSTICADRDNHYFWDALHFSQEAAKQRAQAFYDGPADYIVTPINYKQLVNMAAA